LEFCYFLCGFRAPAYLQHIRRGNAIKLTAPMIRHDDPIDTPIGSTVGVFSRNKKYSICKHPGLGVFLVNVMRG